MKTASNRTAGSSLLGDGRGLILLIVSFGWFLSLGMRLVYPVLVPQVRVEFGLDNQTAGFLFTALMLTYSAMQFPSGVVADRVGERSILIASVLGVTLGCLLFVTAPVFLAFLAGCILFGLGSGFYGPPQISVLSKVFPDRAGTAQGITFASGSVGTVVLPVLAGALAARFGWRWGFGFAIPLFVVTAVGLRVLLPTTEADARNDEALSETIGAVFSAIRQPRLLFVAGAMLLVGAIFQAVSAFLPTYLIEVKGLSQGLATTLFGLFFAGGFVSQVAAGVLADRYAERHILLGIVVTTATAVFALTTTSAVPALLVLVAMLSTISGFLSVANTYFVSTFPDEIQGSGLGLLRTTIIGTGSVSPVLVGSLADAGQFDLAFASLAGLGVTSAALLVVSLLTDP